MNRKEINLRRYGGILLLFCLIFSLLPVRAAAAEQQEEKVVRVGWYEDSYHITGENGARSGYGYEYEQAVAAYTGWKYEYVKGDWEELLEMLQNGEIDLMGALSYTDERAQTMLFSELPMGEEKYYLYANLIDTDISASDLSTLNGKRIITMEKSVQATQFYEWEEEHGIKTQHVFVDSLEKGLQLVKNHEAEGVISTETPYWTDAGMSAISTTGGSNIYYGINKDRPDLKQELDHAMRSMEYDKPFYSDDLYKRYLSSQSTATLSGGEKEWLDEHGAIRIGFFNGDPGVSTVDTQSGKLIGIINDYIDYAKDCLGSDALKFETVRFDSQQEQLQALKDGKIDVIFHASQNPYAAEQNNLALSNTVWTYNLAAVTAKDYVDENEENSIAVEKDNLALKWYISYYYPNWNIIEYDSQTDAEKAVYNGEADCFVRASSQMPQYIKNSKMHSVFLIHPGEVSFAVNRENSLLLSILNKTLKSMPDSKLNGALSMYDNTLRRVTVMDFIRDNVLTVAALFAAFFLCILFIILGFLKKSRASEMKAKEAASRAQELNRKLQESQHELQTALARAEKANTAKTTFLNNMSHDIRTPMNAIVGLTKLMEHDKDDVEKIQEDIRRVQSSSRYLLSLVNDVLDMSRIESSEIKLNREPINMADQIGQIDSIIRPQTQERKQNFIIRVNEVVHEYLIGDSVRLRQVFINLLSNAVKYTPDGGTIIFELAETASDMPEHANLRITVSDTGYGMSPEFVEHIFEPFTRAENSTTNKIQGTGLGMAITKSIVDLKGGTIDAQSELGKGSTFVVTLPMEIDKQAKYDIDAQHVLLIAEDAQFIRNVRAALQQTAVRFDAVSEIQEAKSFLREYQPDVVLMSWHFVNGGYADEIHALCKDSLLFCCDYVQSEQAKQAFGHSGLDGVITRPLLFENFAKIINQMRGDAKQNQNDDENRLAGMRFLCAEDNALNAEILYALMDMMGASCTICSNGAEIVDAFDSVKAGEYDAILMDVQMPVMNGLDATRAIRTGKNPLGKTMPIIAMTANVFSSDVQACLDAGMNAHVAKPIDVEILERTLKTVISTPL